MALSDSILSLLMQGTFGIFNKGSKDEFDSYAEGVVMGLLLGTANVITTGTAGAPGIGVGIGAIQGGAPAMLPLVTLNSLGVMPPKEGAPQPLQLVWYLAISQVATHVLTALQVTAPPTDSVGAGLGIITPGGFSISGDTISKFILLAFIKRGLIVTKSRKDIATMIGKSTEQLMKLAAMPSIPIIGAPSNSPSTGTRVGTIS